METGEKGQKPVLQVPCTLSITSKAGFLPSFAFMFTCFEKKKKAKPLFFYIRIQRPWQEKKTEAI